jgi:UDP-glucuronate decarboxylase
MTILPFSRKLIPDLDYIFDKTEYLVNNLKDKTIFVTGGTGFIGKWLLEFFIYLNYYKFVNCKIIVLTRDPVVFLEKYSHFNVPFIKYIKGDIVELNHSSMPDCDIIIHAATDSDAKLNDENPLKMMDTITVGTRKVLDHGAKIRAQKVLFLSSGAIYGIQPVDISGFTEDFHGAPDILSASSAYAESKRIAELYCTCYQKQFQLDVTIARCFAFVGPYLPLDKHFAIGNFIGNGLKGEDILIKGNGLPLRSYMYSADLIVWLIYTLFRGESGQAYNIGSEHAISIKGLAAEVASFFPNQKVTVLNQISTTDRNQDYVPSTKKIREELSVPDILSLHDAIYRTIRYYSENE